MILQETYKLNNGLEVPKVGLGTWLIKDEEVGKAVQAAIDMGYRHIDTAQAYQNERGVGQAVRNTGVNRKDIFVTSKLDAGIKSYDEAVKSIDESLQKMGLDYLDLMIIHSPKPWKEFQGEDRHFKGNREAWKALEDAYKAGKLKSIGVSNFEKEDLENILESCTVKPMINQILVHIANTPADLIQFCKDHDILVEAYSPIGHGELFKMDEVAKKAEKYNVSVPQLGIRYALQLGLLPLPKTANPAHMKNNADLDFEISQEDMKFLQNMARIKDYGEASKFPVYA
jgi:diketogulonate reductase-like aldo/keto reductase